jgi:Xaa-Pro dipeptidase
MPLTPDWKDVLLQRHARLALAMQNAGIEILALNPGPSLIYLTGLPFHLMERPTVGIFRPHQPLVLILPELEVGKLAKYPLPIQSFAYGEDPTGWPAVFHQAMLAVDLQPGLMGVEPTRMRYLEMQMLETAAQQARGDHNVSFTTAESVLAELRGVKDASEQAAMQQAVTIAQAALTATLPTIQAGISEQQIAGELLAQLYRHGSAGELPFMPIVAAGPNSANPHAIPGERILQDGDLLIIDWGAGYEGYISDLTRTFAIGTVDDELALVAQIVAEANEAGRAAVKPGVRAGDVDRAAREVIETAGYGEYFIHRTGHGIGMEGHEAPYIYAQNNLVLQPGMTFTIEPGIYLPGRGGVRIEDNVVVTADGCHSFSDLPRNLQTL